VKHLAVIGGGISGIAAALELAGTQQVQVSLLEANGRLGGVLETVRNGDYLVERSADNFSTLIPDALLLSQKYGLAADLIQPNSEGRQAFVYLGGKIYPIPAGFSLMQPTRWTSIVGTPTLSWTGKLRLLAEYWVPPRNMQTTADGKVPSANSATTEDESLESFAVRRLGKEAFERLVEPIVSGIFTADPKTLSMAATMPQFVEMERSCGGLIRGYLAARKKDAAAAARKASGARYDSFVAPRHGMSDWIGKLASQLPPNCIRLNTRVSRIDQHRGLDNTLRWRVDLANDHSTSHCTESQEYFDGVILATPAAVTSRLLRDVSHQASSLVAGIPYASSAVAAMIVSKSELASRLDGFGIVVPRCEDRATLAISFTSNKYPGRVPEDQILLRLFLGGALNPQLVEQSDQELLKLAYSEVRAMLGWTGQRPLWQALIRWKDAMPQYLVGHLDRVAAIQQALISLPTLKLCGAAYQGVGIPQCVRSGLSAARQLVKSLDISTT